MNEERLPEQPRRGRSGFFKGFLSGALAVLVIVAVLAGANHIVRSGGVTAGRILNSETRQKIDTLARYIQSTYYEDVDLEELQEGLYAGLFENLDQYSQYYTAEEYREIYESNVSGTYCGIGASLQQDEQTGNVTVVFVYEDSPAEEAGLMKGDMIVSADDYQAADMDLTSFVGHIRGEEKTKVHLQIYRESSNKMLEFDITRREMVLPTVTSEMLKQDTGYIKVSEFTAATPEQFSQALQDLKVQGMSSLIVDLRSNPGGMLNAVCEMADEILPEGLIVYTEDRAGKREEFRSTSEKSMDIPLAVLVDDQSASASEIFAGAIQDRHAGTIIGTTTFGKGVVQTIRTLNDGSAFKLTTNRYFTPGGTCIQDIGIQPDVELEYQFLGKEGEKYSYSLDNQILRAMEELKKQK